MKLISINGKSPHKHKRLDDVRVDIDGDMFSAIIGKIQEPKRFLFFSKQKENIEYYQFGHYSTHDG